MVYTGPSKACVPCKRRRVKCDTGRPSCQNCLRRGDHCFGYPRDHSQIEIRDESAAVARRVQRGTHLATSWDGPNLVDLNHAGLCFFFQNYCLNEIGHLKTRGFFEMLPAFYESDSTSDTLRLAISALAVSFLGMWSGYTFATPHSDVVLRKALRAVRESLEDSSAIEKDETLLAVIVLTCHDNISCRETLAKKTGKHNNGALAIVKHRRSISFASEQSQWLLTMVRHQYLTRALVDREAIDPDRALWDDPPHMWSSPIRDLDEIMFAVVKLLLAAEENCAQHSSDPAEIHEIHERATWLDYQLSNWCALLPSTWHAVRVQKADISLERYNIDDWYTEYADIYPSVKQAAGWNLCRSLRLEILTLLLQFADRLLGDHSLEENRRVHLEQQRKVDAGRFQITLDDMCASVPFHLGNRRNPGYINDFQLNERNMEFPAAPPGSPAGGGDIDLENDLGCPTDQQKRECLAVGGWNMIDPLVHVMKLLSGPHTVLLNPHVRPGQFAWIMRQFNRVIVLQRMRQL